MQMNTWRAGQAPQKRLRISGRNESHTPSTKECEEDITEEESDYVPVEPPNQERIELGSSPSSSVAGALWPIYRPSMEIPSFPSQSIFHSLGLEVNLEEGALLQQYLTTYPSMVYGTNTNGSIHLLSDRGLAHAQTSPIALQGILIKTETYAARAAGRPIPASVFQRRARLYQLLNQMISESQGQLTREIVLGALTAIIVEARTFNDDLVNVHRRGYEQIIPADGGLERVLSMFSPPTSQIHHILVYLVGGHQKPSKPSRWRDALERALEMVNELAAASSTYVMGAAQDAAASAWDRVFHNPTHRKLLDAAPLSLFMQHQEKGYLGPLLQKSHFLAVFLVVWFLWETRDDPAQTQYFLEHLARTTRSTAYNGQGHMTLNLEGFLFLVIEVLFNVYEQYNPATVVTERQSRLVRTSMNLTKLCNVLEDSNRTALVRFLCSCANGSLGQDPEGLPAIDTALLWYDVYNTSSS
ncbi:hypothetical protein ASPZODRAFT_14198 [Penicilliopsis zonata CBS 506.65]|uniref:Transcription factor domain-containing protein n=1 Tax=Penicilliopsis zonata CBS 506.65 TaxID=1073090 RepID=A0A1L9SQU9_9EURO|nr:hypothetical protein ASPZODRAFT_14198 [Penicilliopsis zonata CBS 506.65]OJJ49483.1 hypothetical protein ASPZODRAFT_14198 [Penicilliopsis zonata CBS 506.65]